MQNVSRIHGKGATKRKEDAVNCLIDKAREGDAWGILRLFWPELDKERGPYMLKQRKLGLALLRCFSANERSPTGQAVLNYLKPASGKAAGNFALLVTERLFKDMCSLQDGADPRVRELKVGDVNAKLDELAGAAGDLAAASVVLRWLLSRCTPSMAFYLVQIILRELHISLGVEYVLRLWHPDALDCYNSCSDLRRVLTELAEPGAEAVVGIRLGFAAMPQLALAMHSLDAVVSAMQARFKLAEQGAQAGRRLQFLVEPKLDGERQQIHKLDGGGQTCYWSRRGNNHAQQPDVKAGSGGYHVFDEVIRAQVKPATCILDGELIAFNTKRCKFEVFGSLRTLSAAADSPASILSQEVSCQDFESNINTADPEWTPPQLQHLELVYVAWDILFMDGVSTASLPLLERRELLRQAIAPAPPEGHPVGASRTVRGRIVPLLPDVPLLGCMGCMAAPKLCSTAQEVGDILAAASARAEEGIVIKCVDSQWQPGDRSGSWLKIKPDYLKRCEVDCLIIGAWWGENGCRGMLSEYLVALAQRPRAGSQHPSSWASFAKVGIGFSDHIRTFIHDSLVGNCTETRPTCYKVVRHPVSKPHLWVRDPLKSLVLEVHADLRLIASCAYATKYSLRFPRFERLRHDKDALTVTSEDELEGIVRQKQGYLFREDMKHLVSPSKLPKTARLQQPPARKPRTLPAALALMDVSQIQQESSELAGCCICVLNFAGYELNDIESLIKLMGGSRFARFVSDMVGREGGITHVLAGKPEGRAFAVAQAADCDVLSVGWVERCFAERARVLPRPAEYLHISSEIQQRRLDWDRYGNPFFEPVSDHDVAALLGRMSAHDCLLEPAFEGCTAEGFSSGVLGGASLFHGCRFHLLDWPVRQPQLPTSQPSTRLAGVRQVQAAAAVGHDALDRLGRGRLAFLAVQQGGSLARELDDGTTHLLVAPQSGSAPQRQLTPEELLTAVEQRGGGAAAVRRLRCLLEAGGLALLSSRWLEASCDAAQGELGSLACLPETDFQALGTTAEDLAAWPWRQFISQPACSTGEAEEAAAKDASPPPCLPDGSSQPPRPMPSQAAAAPGLWAPGRRGRAAADADAGRGQPPAGPTSSPPTPPNNPAAAAPSAQQRGRAGKGRQTQQAAAGRLPSAVDSRAAPAVQRNQRGRKRSRADPAASARVPAEDAIPSRPLAAGSSAGGLGSQVGGPSMFDALFGDLLAQLAGPAGSQQEQAATVMPTGSTPPCCTATSTLPGQPAAAATATAAGAATVPGAGGAAATRNSEPSLLLPSLPPSQPSLEAAPAAVRLGGLRRPLSLKERVRLATAGSVSQDCSQDWL